MISKLTIIWIVILCIAATSAIWLNYHSHKRERIKVLETTILKQEEELYRRAMEMNRLSKERNSWIFEANRLRHKLAK